MRIATYSRISTDESNQPYSLGAQAERLASYIASQDGWEHVARYSDQASGAKLDRPGLTKALRDASLGRFDVLLVYRVDRLCRSVGLLADLLGRLDAAGVGFRSATEPFETTTPSGRMMMQMLGVFAEFERASIIERVVMGMGRKAASGRWVGGTQPFGYRRAPEGGRLVTDPAEAPLVPLFFDLYVHRLLGSHAIAEFMNEHGYRTRPGKPFSFKSVLTILRNRAYLGEVGWRGEWYPADHEALVERSVFEKAQALLDERGEDVSKRASLSSDYLLTGLVVCSCGSRFTGTAAHGRSKTYRYYTCGSRQRHGKAGCQVERIRAEELDEAILSGLLDLMSDGTLVMSALQQAHEAASSGTQLAEQELGAIEQELAQIEQAIERYLSSFERGNLPEEICGNRVLSLGERAEQLRRRRSELLDEQELATNLPPGQTILAELRTQLEEAVRSGSPAHVKAFVQRLVHEVRVEGPGTVRPVYRVPMNSDEPDPGTVRAPSRSVGARGLEPPTSAV